MAYLSKAELREINTRIFLQSSIPNKIKILEKRKEDLNKKYKNDLEVINRKIEFWKKKINI